MNVSDLDIFVYKAGTYSGNYRRDMYNPRLLRRHKEHAVSVQAIDNWPLTTVQFRRTHVKGTSYQLFGIWDCHELYEYIM
jgi:hypothetical protein